MSTLGADATYPATPALINLAGTLLGNEPAFLRHYFKAPHSPSSILYQSDLNASVLHSAGIRLLFIGGATDRVGGIEKEVVADAVNSMAAVVSSFGADYLATLGFESLFFLDTGPTTPMSPDYFAGRSEGVAESRTNCARCALTVQAGNLCQQKRQPNVASFGECDETRLEDVLDFSFVADATARPTLGLLTPPPNVSADGV